MNALGYHIILHLSDGRVIAPTQPQRRMLARVVLEQGRGCGLLAFRGADTHLHLEVPCDRPAAGRLVRRLKNAVWRRLELPIHFDPVRLKAIEGQHHLRNLFLYVLRQEQHHGIGLDPYHDSSNLPDLLGMRLLGGYTVANVRAFLPRVTRAELLDLLGLADLDRVPWSAAQLASYLADSAAAAAALPGLAGRSDEVVQARRAAVHVAREVLSTHELAALLGFSERSVLRLRREAPQPELVRAVELQLRLRSRLAVAAGPTGHVGGLR
ncbi:MAG: hypothetical protein HY744_07415 [Deltaproteobacteria bacterium]|nr:hypothetical protein [Deltaproteobacteria bacterium]